MENCENDARAGGYCGGHYIRVRKYDDPLADKPLGGVRGPKPCKVENCEKEVKAKGYCGGHYYRVESYGDPLADKPLRAVSNANNSGPCAVPGCERDAQRGTYCLAHYERVRKHGDPQADIPLKMRRRETIGPCKVPGCEKPSKTRGYCQAHYHRVWKHGDPQADIPLKMRRRETIEPCKADYCEREAETRGYCLAHYHRLLKHGDAEVGGALAWSRQGLLNRIEELRPVLPRLSEEQCHAVIEQAGMIPALRRNFGKASVAAVLKDLRENDGRGVEESIQSTDEFDPGDEIEDAILNGGPPEEVAEALTEDAPDGLPTPITAKGLHATDEYVSRYCNPDSEAVEYIERVDVARLWDAYVGGGATAVDEILRGEGGAYFKSVRSRFRSELAAVESLDIPKGWSFPSPPLPMQRRTAVEVRDRRRVGNWSGTGAGKTGSAILASRVVDARVTLIVGANVTMERVWRQEIKAMYRDSVVYMSVPEHLDRTKHTYIVLNYEKFQLANARNLIDKLATLGVDFVVLDEVQKAKQRDRKASKRRKNLEALMCLLSEQNPELCLLGMSATPVINNLVEAQKLLELITGESYDDLGIRPTVPNALGMRRALMLNGFRYHRAPGTKAEVIPLKVEAGHLRHELGGAMNPSQVEQVLLPAKLEAITPHVQKGSVIYSHYTTGIIGRARRHFEAEDFSVAVFTGEEKDGLDDFMDGKRGVLLGSQPVGTGLDGLQNVSDRIFVLSLPWTSAERDQLQGRIERPGSPFEQVYVYVPQVTLNNGGDIWSWDEIRMRAINHKRALADCAVEGNIPTSLSISQKELLRRSKEALDAWIQRLEEEGPYIVEREKLTIPLPPDVREKLQMRRGDFATMNNRWGSSNSTTTHERLQAEPEEWYLYHTLYRETRQGWDEVPAEVIASHLKGRPDLKVGDFGCGECLLRDALPDHEVIGFDHVAIDESVVACDMAHTSLEDGSLGAAVFSLSLLGHNWPEYLTEACRTLQPYGLLFVAEPRKRFADGRQLVEEIKARGFKLLFNEQRGGFRYIGAVKA